MDHHETDLYLMEFNENGDQLKEQTIMGEQTLSATAIKRLRDGNYILIGKSRAYRTGPSDDNMHVLKLSSSFEN